MIKSLVHIVFLFAALNTIAQNDTINQVDEQGRKQGYWIIYGKDHSSAKVPLFPNSQAPPQAALFNGPEAPRVSSAAATCQDAVR